MNHDYTHCSDYHKGKCPKECFRGELVRDLNRMPYMRLNVSFASLEGTEECLLNKEDQKGADD